MKMRFACSRFESYQLINSLSQTIFDVQYTGLEGGSYGCLVCLEGNAGPGFQGIRQYNGPIYGDGNSYNLPTQNLYDAFDASDPEEMPPY